MDKIEEYIRQRNVTRVLERLFATDSSGVPGVRSGFKRETELWDFKGGMPSLRSAHDVVWADIAADIAAFHNNKGGVLVFGIEDITWKFVGTRDPVDAKRFNDKIRRYLGDTMWVEFSREFIQADQRYLGVALVQGRDLIPLRMQCDAPVQAGHRAFNRGDLCVREGDSTRIYRGAAADQYLAKNRLPSPDSRYLVNDAHARILRPDWREFIVRDELCPRVLSGLRDERTYVTTLSGIGGIGKTALASWAVLQAYKDKQFEFIISASAKDRELTDRGLRPIEASLTSYEDLINAIIEVLGFSELLGAALDVREEAIRTLLPGTEALLFVDNLETLDDGRVINFLETLPKPVKAITTSRTSTVRTAAFPVSVGPLADTEAVKFFDHYAGVLGRPGLRAASAAEKQTIVRSCSSVPLALQWLIGHSKDVASALRLAESISRSGAKDDDLLEFCFRRVHLVLSDYAKGVLAGLTLTDKPQPIEAISVASGLSLDVVEAAVEELQASSLVERVWDDRTRDLAMRCLPITKRFAYRELQRTPGEEQRMRVRLSDWYEGKDISDPGQREFIINVRQGKKDPDIVLVDAAIAYRRQGKSAEAERYFVKAIERNSRSWRAHREYAELLRDEGRVGAALSHYEDAASSAPARGEDRARIFREWGMLIRTAGTPDALRQAIEKFEIALEQTPHDQVLLHALASCYVKKGSYKKAQPMLEQLVESKSAETRMRSYDPLLVCYEKLHETLKLNIMRVRRDEDDAAKDVRSRSKRNVITSSRPLSGGTSATGRSRAGKGRGKVEPKRHPRGSESLDVRVAPNSDDEPN